MTARPGALADTGRPGALADTGSDPASALMLALSITMFGGLALIGSRRMTISRTTR